MGLKEYNKKRDFKKTNEPKGKKKTTRSKSFVIQYHMARAKHYDFRLEHNGVLLSWAVPKGLSTNPKDKRLAVMVEDHPLDYAIFEGIIPKGNYGAGTVEIFDRGEYYPTENIEKGLKKGHLKFVLNGRKLKGAWSLVKTDEKNWLIIKAEDEFANAQMLKKTNLPFANASVQLATPSSQIPKGKDWIFEIKQDGYRIVSYVEKGKVKMLSRNNLDYTSKFKEIAESLKTIDQDSFVVDGEVVAFDKNGRSDFGLLQDKIKSGGGGVFYVIFDLLALNGDDLRNLPLLERKTKLERLLFKAGKILMYSAHVDKGKQSFEFARENNLEGVIAKKADSKYEGKRSEDWLKIKCYKRQEFIIIGYTQTDKNELISALMLAYYDKKKLQFVGKVGAGLSESSKKELCKLFKKYIQEKSPLRERRNEKNATWLKPHFVAEVQYAELTKEKLLRQANFVGLRKDKNAKDVKLEEVWS